MTENARILHKIFNVPLPQSDEVISSQLLGPTNDIASTAMAQRLGRFIIMISFSF